MARVTSEDIQKINEIYYRVHTYAETARQTGFSASTVKRYVIPDWRPVDIKVIKKFEMEDIPTTVDTSIFKGIDNYGELCVLSEAEKQEIRELWEEMAV